MDFFEAVRWFASLVYGLVAGLAGAVAGFAICIVQSVAEYLIACWRVLSHARGLPDRRRAFTPPPGGDPARPSYFWGPARSDLRYIRQVAWSRWQNSAGAWLGGLSDMLDTADTGRIVGPPVIGMGIGMVVAVPPAAVLVAVLGLIHELLVGIIIAAVRCTAAVLRTLDNGLLRVRHIKVRCVACFERISYPAYLCPDPDCPRIHWDIRPGRYGVLRRTCQCGQPMPTTLLLGAGRRLDAICPYRACQQPLEHRPGGEREMLLPIFGAKGAGKTLLLYGIIKTLRGSAGQGIEVEYADSDTADRMQDFDSVLAQGLSVPVTPPGERSKAYVLRLRVGRHRRIVQLLDAAGELFYNSQRSADLVYLGAANTFVLVIDPLSIGSYWDRLPPAVRERLTPYRSIARHPRPVYQQTVDRITEMGRRQRASRRLAIVFSRADVIGTGSGPGESTGEAVRNWAQSALGLAGLLREADSDFREVALFHTAAFHTAAFGGSEHTLTDLVRWLMRAEGITPRASADHEASLIS